MKQLPNESFKMLPPHLKKILDQLTWTISQPGYLKTFHVEFFVRFESMQKIGLDAFLIEHGTMVSRLNNYFRKHQIVLD